MPKVTKRVGTYLREHKGTESARILGELVAALDSDGQFRLVDLYALPIDAFELALELVKYWRLKHYTKSPHELMHTITETRRKNKRTGRSDSGDS